MTPYKIIAGGDATAPQAEGMKFIPHVCNSIGGWGSGFVVSLSNRWKKPEEKYRQWYHQRLYTKPSGEDVRFQLGEIQPVKVESDLVVVNIIGQRGTKSLPADQNPERPPIRYGALVDGMRKTAVLAKKYKASIHCPKFGSKLAGGNWEAIELMIFEMWIDEGIPVTVYDFDAR